MKLTSRTTVKLHPKPPFVFDPTFHKPDHFTSGDNYWESGIKWQTWDWQGKCLGLKFKNSGTASNPGITLQIFSKTPPPKKFIGSLIEEVKYRYNLDLDLKDFYKQFRNHPILGSIIKKWRGMRPGHPSSLYEYLIIGVVLQNATIRRSVQMFKALLENYGTLLEYDGKKLWCFWKPGRFKNISIDQLKSLKVGYRAKYIKHIDEQFTDGLLYELKLRGKDLETQRKELLKIYGVGPATSWYLLFDVFHHWNFFTHVSPWEQKIYSKLFFNRETTNPAPVSKILRYIDQFGEYKQLAVHYIWEDIWWKRKHEHVPWLEKEIRV